MSVEDTFGTAGLRVGVVAAWRDSPTRLREDAATEADLVRAGYRDRVLTELAQNAADAAAKAGVEGRVAVWLDGRELHVANTGVGLDVSGVHALTALRASSKSGGSAEESGGNASVGRFGVGFTAVLSVADEAEFRSVGGSVVFSRARTWDLIRSEGVGIPEGVEGFAPPALRLAWPLDARPANGFDTEIVLRLRDDIDAAELLAGMRAEAVDLLLELPALQRIRIGDDELVSTVTDLGVDARVTQPVVENPAVAETRPTSAEPDDGQLALDITGGQSDSDQITLDLGVGPADAAGRAPSSVDDAAGSRLQELRITGGEEGEWVWWQFRTGRVRWLVPVRDGRAVAARPDVLRAPTRSDEELSLPALMIADIAMQPDRRRLLPGARVAELASGYADFARALPPRDRLVLVPVPGFARSEADGLLREALVEELRRGEWLPVLGRRDDGYPTPADAFGLDADPGSAGGSGGGHDALQVPPGGYSGANAAPARASVFTGVTPELAPLLAEMVGPLVIPELSGRMQADALAVLDVHRIGLARIAELSASLEREPQWWYSLYDALEPFVGDPLAVEELGALAVPLTDGRLVTGPRTAILDEHLESAIPVHWARLVHPEAAHELLGRLGARQATAEDLLNDPALQAYLEDEPGDPDTVDAVLGLAAHVGPAAGVLPTWLGLIELASDTGELLPADELLLPGAPLARVLVADSPFATVSEEVVERHGAQALRAVGVGWSFTLVAETDPTGPDHHLDDEESWWESLAEDPAELVAVRDLDLVDDAEWPEALRLLLSDESTRPLLADRDGYTAWWLRQHAHIDGIPLGLMRHPDDKIFAGLLPLLPGFESHDLAVLRGVLAAPQVLTAQLAEELLDALADPARIPTPEAISETYRLLAETLAEGRLDTEDLVLPDRVRAISGAVIPAADALVLDLPWFGPALPADRLVVGDIESATALADLLDLPLASQAVVAKVTSEGHHTTWTAAPLGVLLRLQFGFPARTGELVVHEDLRVHLSGAYEGTVAVSWWEDGDVTHVQAASRS
ncbi:ATP-binding protein [Nocardia huaxiensis]|uniref:ATP-binding protein n=1 Tax=Nocardia huaxiensis TaxID=2755382 RepID=A0A7D6VCB9_9NOCA|nr:ATP-binding protein [Nocardia huaxiensis]